MTATRSRKPKILSAVPAKAVPYMEAIVVMFRVLEQVVDLPADIPSTSPEGKALKGSLLPNGWIGMASAESPIDLFWCIDEFVDPFSVELMLVPSGGMCIFSPRHCVLPRGAQKDRLTAVELNALDASAGAPLGLEFTEGADMGLSVQSMADYLADEAAAANDDDEPVTTWAHVLQAYNDGVVAGKWFRPKWPKRVYG